MSDIIKKEFFIEKNSQYNSNKNSSSKVIDNGELSFDNEIKLVELSNNNTLKYKNLTREYSFSSN